VSLPPVRAVFLLALLAAATVALVTVLLTSIPGL
jgi:hypothetical protein